MATYKSTMRTISAAAKRHQREVARRQRELERQQKQLERLAEQERAAFEVEIFENHVEVITTLHHDVGPVINWNDVARSAASPPPPPVTTRAAAARQELAAHKPGLVKKRAERRRHELELAVTEAVAADAAEHADLLREYEASSLAHQESVELAKRILSRDLDAYGLALQEVSEISEVAAIGETIRFTIDDDNHILATLDAHSDDIVPPTVKTLLASGKLSEKKMPVGRKWDIYQDHICSAAIRVARDIFGLLPVERTSVTVIDQILNSSTGYKEDQAILSVAIPRTTLDSLNIDMIDPSDAMSNFIHQMEFRKTKGFLPIQPVDIFD